MTSKKISCMKEYMQLQAKTAVDDEHIYMDFRGYSDVVEINGDRIIFNHPDSSHKLLVSLTENQREALLSKGARSIVRKIIGRILR